VCSSDLEKVGEADDVPHIVMLVVIVAEADGEPDTE
jgi:hypothetical protein